MNPYQQKLFKDKYNNLNQETVNQTNEQTQQNTGAPNPIFKTTSQQETNPVTQNYQQMPKSTFNKPNLENLAAYNSSKLAIRFSSEYFPYTKKTMKSTSIPLTAAITPFPSLYAYQDFPTANFGVNNQIIRCEECRAYVNPFSQFIDQGYKFKCNLCNATNTVPNYYVASLDQSGQRVDKEKRIELNHGTFDITAGSDYMARPPMPPIYFFVLDVSQKSIESGVIEMACNIITELINESQLWGDTRTKVGFLCYDSNIHLLDLSPNLKQPKMVTLTDIEHINRLPVPENLLVNLADSKNIVLQLLRGLPSMFGTSKDNGSDLTNSIKIASSILKLTGGRIYIIQANPNILNEKSLTIKGPPNTIEKKMFLIPTGPNIMELTPEMHQNFISCDIFIYSNQYKNAITLGELARYLNGHIHYYPENQERNHKFYFEFKTALTREYTWETVFRIRVSAGWRVQTIYGNYSIKSSGDLLSVPNIDDSQSILYEFSLDEEFARSSALYIQTALLYTNSYGERRIRVINYGVPLTDNLQEIQANVDYQVLGATLLRQCLQKIYVNPSLPEMRNHIISKANLIFSEISPRTKKSDPIADSMLSFSLLVLGILKHNIFLEKGLDYSKETDIRNVNRIKLNMLNIEETSLNFVPYLFALHTFEEEEVAIYDQDNNFVFPQLLSLSATNLSGDGIYLMDDGCSLYMLVGSNVSQTIMNNLFGINSIQDATALNEDMMYHNSNDGLVTKVYNLITELRSRKSERYMYLYIIKEGERSPAEYEFYAKLIEDKINIPQAYNVSYQEMVEILSRPITVSNPK